MKQIFLNFSYQNLSAFVLHSFLINLKLLLKVQEWNFSIQEIYIKICVRLFEVHIRST